MLRFDLLAGRQVLDLNTLILDLGIHDNRKRASVFLRRLKLLSHFGGDKGVVNDAAQGVSQGSEHIHGFRSVRFVGNYQIHASLSPGREWIILGLEDFPEDDVADAETEGGQIDAAEVFEERVVAAATGDGAEFARAVEDLKNDAGVVGCAVDDAPV